MTIEELIERLEKSEGGSRDLDGAIEVEARRQIAYSLGLSDETRAKWEHSGGTVFDPDTSYDAPAYTASLDAAVALAEKVLPTGTDIKIETSAGGAYHHCDVDSVFGVHCASNAPSPAIAICVAILKALEDSRP